MRLCSGCIIKIDHLNTLFHSLLNYLFTLVNLSFIDILFKKILKHYTILNKNKRRRTKLNDFCYVSIIY